MREILGSCPGQVICFFLPCDVWWPVLVRARAANSKGTVSSVPAWFRADSGTNLIKQGEILTGRPCGSVAQWSECSHGVREFLDSSPGRVMCFFLPWQNDKQFSFTRLHFYNLRWKSGCIHVHQFKLTAENRSTWLVCVHNYIEGLRFWTFRWTSAQNPILILLTLPSGACTSSKRSNYIIHLPNILSKLQGVWQTLSTFRKYKRAAFVYEVDTKFSYFVSMLVILCISHIMTRPRHAFQCVIWKDTKNVSDIKYHAPKLS